MCDVWCHLWCDVSYFVKLLLVKFREILFSIVPYLTFMYVCISIVIMKYLVAKILWNQLLTNEFYSKLIWRNFFTCVENFVFPQFHRIAQKYILVSSFFFRWNSVKSSNILFYYVPLFSRNIFETVQISARFHRIFISRKGQKFTSTWKYFVKSKWWMCRTIDFTKFCYNLEIT